MSELQADHWEKEKLVKTKTQNLQKQYEDRIDNLHVIFYFHLSRNLQLIFIFPKFNGHTLMLKLLYTRCFERKKT